jgi:hypothetical protein
MGGMCPPHFPTDRECIERIIMTCGKLDPYECSIAHIANTMELDEMLLSEDLLAEVAGREGIEIVGPARELEFDSAGALEALRAPVAAH